MRFTRNPRQIADELRADKANVKAALQRFAEDLTRAPDVALGRAKVAYDAAARLAAIGELEFAVEKMGTFAAVRELAAFKFIEAAKELSKPTAPLAGTRLQRHLVAVWAEYYDELRVVPGDDWDDGRLYT
jgi:hypothetical protein